MAAVGVAVLTLCAGTAMARDGGRESSADMRGLTVSVGGGVEGYTSTLGTDINPGVAYGATLTLKPTKVLGLELGYSGAANNFDRSAVSNVGTRGPDIMRNGGQAVATLGLTAAPLQPYVLAGLGLSYYNVRSAAANFQDDLVGNVPLGGGVRLYSGNFTADARLNYNLLGYADFAQDASAPDSNGLRTGGSYTGTLNIGATW